MPDTTDNSSNEPARLTSKQRAHLRSLAHGNKPVVHVGKDGLSDAVMTSIEEAFNTRELLKIRILDNANEQPRDMAHAIADRMEGVQVVHTMGWTVTFYRPDPDEPQIELP
ncbi:ribosome assembly RNA-binding protein YhbY [Longibacter salinarum]|uniref:Ribosome assembly RNA-binding protein YhbY n=1 Tax=Longibacter salinarum TaxID=1850348 RepID=A0A2A8CYH8_9BACT|nr:ribosome assembly RNA-binding protein YhbY [Longibacter salinarum]PEN13654.1 ribosome assembly RNA-binding protein YhbY [Longibacter salinarum]